MPMNDLRNRQIREALDEDKNMYAKAFELEKRRVQLMDEAPAQYEQLNAESLGQVDEFVQALKIVLERKVAPLQSLLHNQGGDERASAAEVGLIEEPLKYYNMIASIFSNTANTPQTKDMILTKIADTDRLLMMVVTGCSRYITKLTDSANRERIDKYMLPVIRAYNAYELMAKYIQSKNLQVITEQDLNTNALPFRPILDRWRLPVPNYAGIGPPPYTSIAPFPFISVSKS